MPQESGGSFRERGAVRLMIVRAVPDLAALIGEKIRERIRIGDRLRARVGLTVDVPSRSRAVGFQTADCTSSAGSLAAFVVLDVRPSVYS